jgi:hypothetical protein
MGLMANLRSLRIWIKKTSVTGLFLGFKEILFLVPRLLFLGAALAICGFLLVVSPLFWDYSEWRDSGSISSLFFDRLSRVVDLVPDGYTLHLYDVPKGITLYKNRFPKVKTATYLSGYSIQSWVHLYHPGKKLHVDLHSTAPVNIFPCRLELDTRKREGEHVQITVKILE